MALPLIKLRAFQAFGIELEYMICDRTTLNVKPVTDALFFAHAKTYDSEIEGADISWNNELALHVVELKTSRPRSDLENLAAHFHDQIKQINAALQQFEAQLLPTAMHPWMDPIAELRLWPHGDNPWYEQFDKIFNCKGHGWANLQSLHVNFPYGNEEEFVRLHAAIRLALPIIPALAASSPIMDGKKGGFKDCRLDVYKSNSKRIPSITGEVIPEVVTSYKDYHDKILERIRSDLEPHDDEGILEPEWTNARGAITRFERNAIEIRLVDTQECPAADLAVATALIALVKWLYEHFTPAYHTFSETRLKKILDASILNAEEAPIDDAEYLALFGFKGPMTQGALWKKLVLEKLELPKSMLAPLETIFNEGTLATRILKGVEKENLFTVYQRLAACLQEGRQYHP